ncbi:MAG: HisA/HisF-related TIM barrel protein, partial [Candidatus Omnitrophica bacterium]|nr:HisA/HisF-related TIM barrel protein [Candidatus Omnitrophota bacterium]
MLIIPAIDIKNGKVVRLVKGKFKEKVYSADPLYTAIFWQSKGVERLHIVDLDGASRGKPKNIFWVKKILEEINIPIEFGGGVRDLKMIESLLKIGIDRVI